MVKRTSYVELSGKGNLFLLPTGKSEAGVVLTNLMVKSDGKAVMGAGIAKYCRDMYRGIDSDLAAAIRLGKGSVVLGEYYDKNRAAENLDPMVTVMAFPTKKDWRDKSSVALIAESAKEAVIEANRRGLTRIYLPPPGCGLGGLDYARDVRPILDGVLDDRFVVCLP